nr:hypothetical protein [Armatimonadota bacterium]
EPDSALIRPSNSRVSDLVRAACDAGFNMLRIWGGGVYESDHFYELCDEHGILVWQDFPYGCAYYPDIGPYAEAARVEATAAVRRLRIHPSLALWCGNNENQTMFHDGWEGQEGRAPRYLGENLYHKILPAVIESEDAGRPYWPSSPYGGENPNSEECGDRHDWDVWHGRGDWIHYREDNSRFVSEFGFGSSCGMDAWDRCLAPADRWPHSPAVRWHDKTRKGYDTYLGFIALHFPGPQTLTDLVYYSQLNQAEALKCGLEHWRRQKGRCWGLLFWQINDCWPVQSWSIIDSVGERKAAYYSVKRAYKRALLSLLRQDDRVEAYLTNDGITPLSGTVTLSVKTFDGETILEETSAAEVEANGTAAVAELDLTEVAGQERDIYVAARFEQDEHSKVRTVSEPFEYGEDENLLFLAEPKDLRLPDAGLHVTATGFGEGRSDKGFTLQFTAKRLAPYVWWRVPGRMAEAGEPPWVDNFFHLEAGQTRSFNVYFDGEDIQTVDDLLGRLQVRSL